jgi:hypothetical protein
MLFVATVASWNVNIVVVIMMSQPPRACPDPGKGPNTSSQMCPVQIKPWSSLINQFGASRVTYGSKRPFLAIFWPFWRPMAASQGLPGPGKRPIHIVPDVSCPDQALIKFDQPIWGLQGDLWLQKAIFGHFWPLWRPMAAPRGLPGPGKRPKHIVPDVSWPDQTLIKFDQPVWGLQWAWRSQM